jgi:release factor glutamine methyltransferase
MAHRQHVYVVSTFIHALTHQILPVYQQYNQAHRQAWRLLEYISQKTHAQLLAHTTVELTHKQHCKLQESIYLHVQKYMPLEYIFGSVEFLGLTITLEPPVLIPRPETEYWCSQLINLFTQYKYTHLSNFSIADVCTGSGCIALAFASHFPQAHVYALDKADYACRLARYNAQRNTIVNCTVVQSDLFSALESTQEFDLIVSNPPYISPCEWYTLDPSVKKWEAYEALVADDSGLALISELLKQARMRFRTHKKSTYPLPHIALEIGYNQGEAVKKLCLQYGYTQITLETDLAGHDRLITARYDTSL